MKKIFEQFSLLFLYICIAELVHASGPRVCSDRYRLLHHASIIGPNSQSLPREFTVLQAARELIHRSMQSLYSMEEYGRCNVLFDEKGLPIASIDRVYIEKTAVWVSAVLSLPENRGKFFKNDIRSACKLVSRLQRHTGDLVTSTPGLKARARRYFALEDPKIERKKMERNLGVFGLEESEDAATRARRAFFTADDN